MLLPAWLTHRKASGAAEGEVPEMVFSTDRIAQACAKSACCILRLWCTFAFVQMKYSPNSKFSIM